MSKLTRAAVLGFVVTVAFGTLAEPAAADRICTTLTVTATDPDQTYTVCVPLPPGT